MKNETAVLVAIVILACVLGMFIGWQAFAIVCGGGAAAVAAATRKASQDAISQSKSSASSAIAEADEIIVASSSESTFDAKASIEERMDAFDEDFRSRSRPRPDDE